MLSIGLYMSIVPVLSFILFHFSCLFLQGIPNEAFRAGFYSFRWIATFPYIFLGYIGTGVRLRKAGLVRNHSTPIDFITDRFRSQLLRYTFYLFKYFHHLSTSPPK